METETTKASVSKDVENLKSDVHKLRKDMAGILDSAASSSRDAIMRSRNRLREAIAELEGKAKDRLRDTSDTLKERGSEKMDNWRARVEDRPVTAITIAFVAGLVFASIFARRWR
jgi:ElaB/YqjD/DUF883 family membrane-anchored ribosome-binding protein